MAVTPIYLQGDEWSPSGIGSGVTSATYESTTQTVAISSAAQSIKLWLAGHGDNSASVSTGNISQGEAASIPITVHGSAMFNIPPEGCWTDVLSIAHFTTPGSIVVSLTYAAPTYVPTFADNTVPTAPAPVSAVDIIQNTELNISYNTKDAITLFSDACNSTSGWVSDVEGTGTFSISNGLKLSVGASGDVLIYKLIDMPSSAYYSAFDFEFTTNLSALVASNDGYSAQATLVIYPFGGFTLRFCSDGLFLGVGDGPTYTNIGNVVQAGIDQTWRFVVAVDEAYKWDLNLYCNGVFVNSAEGVFIEGSYSQGEHILSFSASENNMIAYVKDIKFIGTPVYDQIPWKDEFTTLDTDWALGGGTLTYGVENGALRVHGTGLDVCALLKYLYVDEAITEYSFDVVAKFDDMSAPVYSEGVYLNSFCIQFTAQGASVLSVFITTTGIYCGEQHIGVPVNTGQYQTFRFEGDSTGTTPLIYVYVDDVYYGAFTTTAGEAGFSMVQLMVLANTDDTIDLSIGEMSISDTINESDRTLTEVTKSGDITINANPSPGETFTVSNSATTVFTFVDHYPNNSGEIQIGATTALTAQALATAINDISGAEFVATVDGSVISVDAYCESAFAMTTTSTGIAISSITEIVPGLTTETITAADSFTATDGGKAVQENATVADSADGLIDGMTEAVSVSTVFDTLNVEMDETIESTVTTDFDGLIDYMGEEI